jgi:uncharacterized OsmC-like protein
VLKRIFVHYTLQAIEELRETVERVHHIHVDHCPVARSIRAAIDIRTSFLLVNS